MFKGNKNDVLKRTFSNRYKNQFQQKTPIGQPYKNWFILILFINIAYAFHILIKNVFISANNHQSQNVVFPVYIRFIEL